MVKAGKPLGTMIIDLKLDDTAFKRGIQGAKQSTRYWMSEMKASMKVMDLAGDSTGKLRAKQEGLTKVIDSQKKELEALVQRYKDSYDEQGNATSKTADYAREVRNAEAKLAGFEAQLQKVTTQIKVNDSFLINSGKTVEKFGKKVSATGTWVKDFGNGLNGVGKTLTNKITKPIAGAATALGSITLVKGFSRLKGIDQATAKLKGLKFEAQDVEKIMESALTSVKGTAFGMDEAATTAANAVAAGIKPGKDLTKYLTLTGDAAAIAGTSMSEMGSIINKVQTGQKAYTEELNQLSDRGIPIYQWIAKEANISAGEVKDFASDGKISSEMFLAAIEHNIGGAAKEMGKYSFTATLDNIWASIGRIGANFLDAGGKGGGFFSTLKPLTEQMLSNMDVLEEKAADLGVKFGEMFVNFIEKSKEAIKAYQALDDWQKDLIKSIGIGVVAAGPAVKILGSITTAVGVLTRATGGIITVFGSVFTKLGLFKNESNFMVKTFPKISSGLKTIGSTVGTALFGPLKNLGSLLTKFIPIPSFLASILGPISAIINPVTLIIGAVAALAGGIFYLNKQTGSFGATFTLLKDTVMNFFSVVYTEYIQPTFTAIVEAFSNMLASIKKFWDENGAQFMQALTNFFEAAWNLIQPTLGFWSGIFGATFNTIVNLVKVAWDTIKGIFSGVFTALGGMIKVFTGIMTGDWSRAWDGMKDIAKGGWNTIASGIEGFANAVLTVIGGLASGMQKGIVGAINGVIKAVNWILEKFGLDGFDEWKVKEIKVGKVKLPKFATGSNGLPFDTLGVVNDQKGSNYEEMIIPKKGKPFIPKGRDVVLPMEKGTQIIPANLTKQYKDSLPHFKKGFFGNVWEGTKNTVGKLWGNIKEFTGDIWDYMSNPKELVQLAVNKFTNIPELPSFWLDMAHGAVKHTADKAVGFVKAKFEEMFDSGGDADTSETGMLGVMQYLSDIAKDVMAKFPGMVATSGYRHGDPYSHGKRQAIDIAYPSRMNGSSKYFEPANYVFNKFRDKVAYVITQGMVRDRKGMSGTGASGQWVRWPDNDHYDHLHINGAIALGEGGSGSGFVGGSGVERWRSTAARALQMTGQYSKANLDRLLYQMKTESGGNPKAINNWDINAINGTPSKGLMQVIDPTFRAYAKPPYNKNIYDPLSNILASIRYAVSRYGSLAAAYRGVGYENGGIITRQHLAMVGEGNKPEMIIPLTRKSRAVELMDKAKTMLGISDNTTVVNDNSELENIVKRLSETVEKQGEMMIALLQLIANKELNISTDTLTKLMNRKQADEVSKLLYGLGGV